MISNHWAKNSDHHPFEAPHRQNPHSYLGVISFKVELFYPWVRGKASIKIKFTGLKCKGTWLLCRSQRSISVLTVPVYHVYTVSGPMSPRDSVLKAFRLQVILFTLKHVK